MTDAKHFNIKYNGDHVARISAKLRLTDDRLVVFLHGFGCAKECFDYAFAADELQDLSICTFDFPGHGESKQADEFAYSLQSYADIANALIKEISPATVSMVCHSMGGAVGLIATQECRNLNTFINVEGNLVARDCGIVSRSTADQSLKAFKLQGFQEFLHTLQSSGRDDDRAWAKWYAHADPSALHQTARSLVEWSDSGKLLDLFKSLQHQIYIYGEYESKNYLVQELSDIEAYCVPNSGHFVMMDNPDVFYSLLSGLLHSDSNITAGMEGLGLSAML